MNAYVNQEQLTLRSSNRISHPEHYADAASNRVAGLGVFGRIAAYFERQRVLTELGGLSDRELADIGLTRPELPMVFQPNFASRRR